MVRLGLSLGVVFLVSFFVWLGESVQASGGSTEPQFEFRLKWGFRDQYGYQMTSWSAMSTVTDTVVVYGYYPHLVSPPILTPTIGSSWTTHQGYSAEPNYMYFVNGFYLTRPGDEKSLFGSFWNSNNCLPGPEIRLAYNGYPEALDSSVRLVVVNTTTTPLYVIRDTGFVPEIAVGSSITVTSRMDESVFLSTNPQTPFQTVCARADWNLSPRKQVQPNTVYTLSASPPSRAVTISAGSNIATINASLRRGGVMVDQQRDFRYSWTSSDWNVVAPVPINYGTAATKPYPYDDATLVAGKPGSVRVKVEVFKHVGAFYQKVADTEFAVTVTQSDATPTPVPTAVATVIPAPTPVVTPVPTPIGPPPPPPLVRIYDLNHGWNLISVPDSGPRTATDLVAELVKLGLGPRQVVRWQDGGWHSYVRGLSVGNFSFEPERGYFVWVTNPGTWVPGQPATTANTKR